MDGEHLAAVVTSEAGQITIRPEPGWKITTATINVTMRRTNTRKEHRTSATIGASSLNEDSTP
jgi:hypothetical protein